MQTQVVQPFSFIKTSCLAMLFSRTWSLARVVNIVSIRSGRRNSVVVNVHFELELTLRNLRERPCLFPPHWPHYSDAIGMIMGDLNVCEPEEGRFNVWNQSFTDGDTGKAALFHSFFPRMHEIAQPSFIRRDATTDGTIRTLSRIEHSSILPRLKLATSTDIPMYFRILENGPYRVTTQLYVWFTKTNCSGTPGQTHTELDVQKTSFFSILKQINDEHQYFDDLVALEDFKIILEKTQKADCSRAFT